MFVLCVIVFLHKCVRVCLCEGLHVCECVVCVCVR